MAEFFYLAESVQKKCNYSSILSSSDRFLGTLLKGKIEIRKIVADVFSNNEEFRKKGYAMVFESFIKFKDQQEREE